MDSDEWAELSEIVAVIDAEVAAVRAALVAEPHSPALATRVQDALLACVALRDLPPQRPTSLRRVSVEGTPRCLDPDCAAEGCLGNRLHGRTLILVHTKTARSRGTIRLEVADGTAAAELLQQHLAWARAVLVGAGDCAALFVGRRGGAFSETAFNKRLTTCLCRWGLGARITHTRVSQRRGRGRARRHALPRAASLTHARAPPQLRHIVATATSSWTHEQRQGARKASVIATQRASVPPAPLSHAAPARRSVCARYGNLRAPVCCNVRPPRARCRRPARAGGVCQPGGTARGVAASTAAAAAAARAHRGAAVRAARRVGAAAAAAATSAGAHGERG